MNKKIKNMVADVVKEMSGTGTGAGMTPGPNPPIATAKAFKKPKEEAKKVKDVEPKLAAGKVKDNYAVSHFGFTPAPHIPNRKSKAMDYKQLFETEEGFNVNKVWDFIESKPFYNKEYMPKFHTAEEIWSEWGPKEKELYTNFTWEDTYGEEIHPREKAALQRRKTYDALAKKEVNENYAHFRNETSKRNPSEQLHKAVKEIKRKLQEVDKLVEYTNRLRTEISEGDGDVKYNTHTERALESITEMIKQTYIKTKKLK